MCRRVVVMALLCVLVSALPVVAQEGMEGMPEVMGPPAEMQSLEYLVGTWDATMESKVMPEDTTWIPSTGVATYRYAAGGAALVADFEGQAAGMKFLGFSTQCFDRATNEWQVTWTDNMSARITLLTGKKEEGRTVLVGDDRWGDMVFKSRVTTYNETATSFDWTYEMSFDGENWELTGRAKYTKRQ